MLVVVCSEERSRACVCVCVCVWELRGEGASGQQPRGDADAAEQLEK